ncbi:recombinase family protein [Mycobacterium sp. AT1]|uniref:recombinase family protein n=1 Tax=Mycobacterium sp. AT1 TaxID=1961706 RepID=UPI0009AEB905|nr:recombinase family protein [Mycobacterium sp. AT1]OPX12061.1 serine recombinase [Mycobacterium sp. AT1]
MQAAVYLRISSDPSGQALGVARQREDCVALCASKGWTPIEYVDNDVSASTGKKRPAYERLLADIGDGRIGAVVAWDLDRLHRRPTELEAFMDLADAHRLALATASGDVDLSTAQGRLTARLKGAVARHEIEHKSDRQKRAAQQKAARGEPQWRNAFGFTYDGSRTPDPVTAPLVKQAYESILSGGSISDIAREWNAAGAHGLTGKPWSASTVSLFLRKPRNAGLRDHNGEIVGAGTWPPLVDEETWRAAQAILDAPGRAPGRKTVRRHLLTGVLRCGKPGCGGHLSGYEDLKKRIAYRCKNCMGVSVRAELVEPLIDAAVAERLARPDAVDLLKVAQHDAVEAQQLRAEKQRLYAQIREAEAEYDDGVIDGRRLAARKERVTEKLDAIERRQMDQDRLRVFDGLPLGTPEVTARVRALSPDRLRAVIDVLVEFTVAPVGKGGRVFHPDRVSAVWK